MTEQVSLSEAQTRFRVLAAHATRQRRRVTITEAGQPLAVLVSPEELADLDEALALADYRVRRSDGTLRTVSHAEVRDRLGFSGR